MTQYLGMFVQQEPFDLGLEETSGRPQYGFDVQAHSRPSASFVVDVAAVLEAAGVASRTAGTLHLTTGASLPSTDIDAPAAFLTVRAVPGLTPVGTHNDGPLAYRRPAATIVATARTAAAAEALAIAACNALGGIRNQAVSA